MGLRLFDLLFNLGLLLDFLLLRLFFDFQQLRLFFDFHLLWPLPRFDIYEKRLRLLLDELVRGVISNGLTSRADVFLLASSFADQSILLDRLVILTEVKPSDLH